MSLNIRLASVNDCDALSDVCFRSKQSNGYDDAFKETCREELRVMPETLNEMTLWLAEDDDVVLGCAALQQDTSTQGEVSLFFVDPNVQGRGVGRMLWTVVFKAAHERKLSTLVLFSDPNAVGFYAKQGFAEVGTSPSRSIPGRMLPKMQLSI